MWPKTTRHIFSNKTGYVLSDAGPFWGDFLDVCWFCSPVFAWSYSPPLFSTMGLPKSKKTEAQLFPWSFICLFYIGNRNKSNKQSFPDGPDFFFKLQSSPGWGTVISFQNRVIEAHTICLPVPSLTLLVKEATTSKAVNWNQSNLSTQTPGKKSGMPTRKWLCCGYTKSSMS